MSHQNDRRSIEKLCRGILLGLFTSLPLALAQVPAPSGFTAVPLTSAPPNSPLVTLTLRELGRAQRLDPQYQSAVSNAELAREDRLQSRAAPLPTLGLSSQYLNAQGNGAVPTGQYVTQDGVHVYREWSVFRQDLSPATLARTDYRRAKATEGLSQTKAEKARLALALTVVKSYYSLVVAQRKYATAQQGLDQASLFVALGQSLERSGRKPHSDVVKFQFQQTAQEKSLREANLAMESARLDLAVLLFRDFDEQFTVVDELYQTPRVPSFSEVLAMAEAKNPDLRIAVESVHVASLNVSIARQAFLPILKVDIDYGIESNCVGVRCVDVAFR